MPTFDRTTRIDAPLERVFDFFAQPENLLRITPPSMKMRIVRGPQRRLRDGDEIEYALRLFGLIPIRWTARLTNWREGESFTDIQLRGPFASWAHTHSFRPDGDTTVMHDHVEYDLHLGLGGWVVRWVVGRAFGYRERMLAKEAQRLKGAKAQSSPPSEAL